MRRRARALALACAAFAGVLAGTGARAAEVLRIAVSRSPVSLPLYVAQQRGFFRDEGLDVRFDECIGGPRCLHELLAHRAEVATSSEMPVVLHAFDQADVAIVGTMTKSTDNLKLIARKGTGIVHGEQLEGRRIGLVAGTAGQYMLETYLLAVGVDPRHVTAVTMQADEIPAALRGGRIDAAAVWEPYASQCLHGADAPGLRLPLAGGYIESSNLVVGRAFAGTHDEALAHLLRAVDRAEAAIQADPAAARSLLAERLGLDGDAIDAIWHGLDFRLALEQSLLTTMEGETRWAQREGHAPAGPRPNVLALVLTTPLKSFKPDAVGTGN